LGTSTRQDVLEDFAQKVVEYRLGESCRQSLSLAFDQKRAADRRQWIDAYMSNPRYETCRAFLASPEPHQVVRLQTFFDEQFVRYCVDDCQRSIPSVMDGLKVSQRKILYSMRLKCWSVRSSAVRLLLRTRPIKTVKRYSPAACADP
jgi:DNA topoisomerase-2